MEPNTNQGSESTAANEQHVQNAAENRDALARQANRTGNSAQNADRSGAGTASGTTRDVDNAAAADEVAANRDALAEQNRRVKETTPDEVDMDRR